MIKVGDKEYKLKVNLGFYKNLSFPQSELSAVYDNASRLFECIKLAVYYGNKQKEGWHCIADMEKVITDEMLEDIDDPNIKEKFSQAVYDNLPDSLKKTADNLEEDSKKK